MLLAPAAGATTSALLREMNEARAAHDLAPLRRNATLARAARAHSLDMLRRDALGHWDLAERMHEHRVDGPFVGENVAWGRRAAAEADAIVRRWLASPHHRANLLSPRFRVVGVGVATGEFAGRRMATVVTADFASAS